MSRITAAVVLWLFVINLGVAFGAGIYEHRIVVSRWITLHDDGSGSWSSDAARQDDTGRRFWAVASTVPLTLITLLSLYAAWRADGTLRRWWLAAALAAFVERVFTFSYFIPTMVGLMAAQDLPESVATASQWWTLNYVRHGIVLAAWLSALKTFAVFHQQQG